MTDPTTEPTAPRPGSRADRMAQPLVRDALRELAERAGVCRKPLVIKRIDPQTRSVVAVLEVPCGARVARKCRSCAEFNRRLRQRQIREGWFLTEEPVVPVEKPSSEVRALLHLRAQYLFERDVLARAEDWAQVKDLDAGIAEVDELLANCRVRGTLPKPGRKKAPRAVRSTRRRQDVPKLPRRRVENRTIGQVFKGKTGKQHRPSMLLTVTLDSFGEVHTGKRMRRG